MAPAALTFLVLIVASTCIAFHPVYDPRLSFVDEMFTVDLGGKWNLTNENGSIVTVGTVPGNVHTDLLAAGLISVFGALFFLISLILELKKCISIS
jgi:hypothetical protein